MSLLGFGRENDIYKKIFHVPFVFEIDAIVMNGSINCHFEYY